MLLINKPLHWTSFDVVNKVRYLIKKSLNKKRVKVGHAGTLDPLATGLLIVCTGKHTKRIAEYQEMEKEYTGKLMLGATTPSYDMETPVNKSYNTGSITEAMIIETAKKFIGNVSQFPPAFSAGKINGERAYKKARRGETVIMKPKSVVIKQFDITGIKLPVVEFRIICSKGTYIRSLVHDFGKTLNNGAYLSSLCRMRIGNYKLEDAVSIYDLRLKNYYLCPLFF